MVNWKYNAQEVVDLAHEHGVPFDHWPHFLRCLENGCTPRLAAMLATKSFPGFSSDDTFMKGGKSGEQFATNPGMYGHFAAMAEAEGVSVCGRKYMHGLARFPGDPEAWVAGKADVLRILQERGWSSTGAVEYTPPEPSTDPNEGEYRVAVDILDRAFHAEVGDMPAADVAAVAADVRDRLSQRLSGCVDDNPLLVSGDVPAEAGIDWSDP
jgi:hypothetical protein